MLQQGKICPVLASPTPQNKYHYPSFNKIYEEKKGNKSRKRGKNTTCFLLTEAYEIWKLSFNFLEFCTIS